MSRCFPYTPVVKAAVDREALVESIKSPRGLEKRSKTHRKKEKKEKENKRNRKGYKDDGVSTCSAICGVDSVARCLKVVETVQLDKSDVTEEHGLPTFTDNMSYLSDGTQSSAKRKRTIIRFKSIPKQNDLVSADEASCSEPKFGTADLKTDTKRTKVVQVPTAETNVEFEKAAFTSGQNLATCDDADAALHHSLIVNWVQPLLQSVLNDYADKEDWLCETKRESSRGSKRSRASSEVVSSSTNHTQWPRAHWLPEPCISALPYTVPF